MMIACVWWLCGRAWAGQLPAPPPLPSEPVAEQNYLDRIAEHHNNLVHYTTGNPNATRQGKPGELIWATFGGSDRLCLNTGAGPGLTTTWKCLAF